VREQYCVWKRQSTERKGLCQTTVPSEKNKSECEFEHTVSVSLWVLCQNPKTQITSHKYTTQEMEGGKNSHEQEQAGPSSAIDKTTHTFHVASEDDEDDEQVFVPSPLLSLKEQIEKDKVLFFLIFYSAICSQLLFKSWV